MVLNRCREFSTFCGVRHSSTDRENLAEPSVTFPLLAALKIFKGGCPVEVTKGVPWCEQVCVSQLYTVVTFQLLFPDEFLSEDGHCSIEVSGVAPWVPLRPCCMQTVSTGLC